MMGNLQVHISNKLDILAEKLAWILSRPLHDTLSPETIIVQSRGMQQWISLKLTDYHGICANINFPFPNAFLEEMADLMGVTDPNMDAFAPEVMAFRIMTILSDRKISRGNEPIDHYIRDDVKGLKRYQLSAKIADVFDQYMVFRPEMIFAWQKGRAHHWQARLWRKLVDLPDPMHRAQLRQNLMQKIRNPASNISQLPQRVSVFGISYLSPFHLDLLTALATRIDVHLFLLNPCREYWADIVSSREMMTVHRKHSNGGISSLADLHLESGNRLLASMGKQGRDFFAKIIAQESDIYEHFSDPQNNGLLAAIQKDILDLNDPVAEKYQKTSDSSNNSIAIHSCHSPMREIEVLHDNLLNIFEHFRELDPKDILVMAPDISIYTPLIESVFESRSSATMRIPYHITDQGIAAGSQVVKGFWGIIDLQDKGFSAPAVMASLEPPSIREKFGLSAVDVKKIEKWVSETNIRWGLGNTMPHHEALSGGNPNSWQAGLERMLLGYAMPGQNERLTNDILPYDPIEGQDAKILGKLNSFMEQIRKLANEMLHPKPIKAWCELFLSILDRFFHKNEASEPDLEMLTRLLYQVVNIETNAGFSEAVDIVVVRHLLQKRINTLASESGFISGRVTFCSMLPMRSVPAKVLCLIGLNNTAFPRQSMAPGFDFIARYPRIGDRSRRQDDRYLFLEAILSSELMLYISYIGQSIRDNTLIPPSSIVSEFIEYIMEGYGISEDCLVTRHKLQAFDSAYFVGDDQLFSYSRENLKASSSAVSQRIQKPFLSKKLPNAPDAWRTIDVHALIGFFHHPARFFLQHRLGIFFKDEEMELKDRESFNLEPLARFLMGQEMWREQSSGQDWETRLHLHQAKGELPPGRTGEVLFRGLETEVRGFLRKTEPYRVRETTETISVDMDISGFRITGHIQDCHHSQWTNLRYGATRPSDRLATWIQHLIICAKGPLPVDYQSVFIGKDSVIRMTPVQNGVALLRELLEYYWKGLSEPLPFFPKTSFAYAWHCLEKGKPQGEALNKAAERWYGNEFVSGEAFDSYNDLCFQAANPLDDRFAAIAMTIFEPMLSSSAEIRI